MVGLRTKQNLDWNHVLTSLEKLAVNELGAVSVEMPSSNRWAPYSQHDPLLLPLWRDFASRLPPELSESIKKGVQKSRDRVPAMPDFEESEFYVSLLKHMLSVEGLTDEEKKEAVYGMMPSLLREVMSLSRGIRLLKTAISLTHAEEHRENLDKVRMYLGDREHSGDDFYRLTILPRLQSHKVDERYRTHIEFLHLNPVYGSDDPYLFAAGDLVPDSEIDKLFLGLAESAQTRGYKRTKPTNLPGIVIYQSQPTQSPDSPKA
ncbi:MAG: hypothetical protein HYW23_00355 [Candidatus Aenigmarchaeota archaeon]|nr:hypothetical protein [Candidatus Aenigmarchaeota archaeon]